jgi:hypothetical protein
MVMLFAAAACSPAAIPDSSLSAPASAAGAAQVGSPSSAAESPSSTVKSPFGRRDVPPGAVAEWNAYGSNTETTGGCEEGDGAGGLIVLLQPSDGIGIPTFACAGVLKPGTAVDFELILPNGVSIDHQEVVDELGVATWVELPLQAPIQGRYVVRAEQGSVEASSTVDARATDPTLVVSPYSNRIGDEIQVIVAGTNVPVELYLYRPENREVGGGLMPGWAFVTTLGTVTPDASGEGSLTIRSSVEDTPTRYRIEGEGLEGTEVELVP